MPLQLQRSGCSAKRKEWIWLGQRLTVGSAYITHTLSTEVMMPLGHRPQIDRQAGAADPSSPCRPGGCGRSRSHRPDQEPRPARSVPVSCDGFTLHGRDGSQAIRQSEDRRRPGRWCWSGTNRTPSKAIRASHDLARHQHLFSCSRATKRGVHRLTSRRRRCRSNTSGAQIRHRLGGGAAMLARRSGP